MADTRQLELAWAAGFLDGEGCFSLRKFSPAARAKGLHEATRGATISAAQTSAEPLYKLAEILGGRVRDHRGKTSAVKQTWQWEICSKDGVRYAIPLLLPYLVVKKQEAEIVLAYAQEPSNRGRKYTNDEITRRLNLIEMYQATGRV